MQFMINNNCKICKYKCRYEKQTAEDKTCELKGHNLIHKEHSPSVTAEMKFQMLKSITK